MLITIAVMNLSLNIVLLRGSPSVLDLFLMGEFPKLSGIYWDIAKLAYMIKEVV